MNDASTAIRPFQDHDEAAVIGVWHGSGRAAYGYLPTWQALTLGRAREIFRQVILPRCDIWVGTRHDQVVAFLAMAGSYIDRMFVDPAEWRKGWGTRFVLLAKTLHPSGLELHTHQETMPPVNCTRSMGSGSSGSASVLHPKAHLTSNTTGDRWHE